MKKFFVLSFMVLSMIFFVSCSNKSNKDEIAGKDGDQTNDTETDDSGNDGDADTSDSGNDTDSGDSANDDDTDPNNSGTDDIDPEFVVDENLFEVPADQNNTEGALCDPQTFVEFCDGNAYVYCSEQYENDEITNIVEKYECDDEESPVCFTYRRNDEGWEHNWAACFSRCETIGKGSECTSEDDGFYFWYYESTCKQTSKGKLLFFGEYIPCNSACSEDGKTCEIKECNPETDAPTCDENGVLHYCDEYSNFTAAEFCALDGAVCGYDEFFEESVCIYSEDEEDEWGND
ncbi:hypothetical protein J6Z19_05785 [bacterium]|nr:hypothetical protein [bacterium]